MSEQQILAVVATVLAGILRTSTGVGSGIALTASLSLLFDPHLTLAIMAYLQIGLGASALTHYWRQWQTPIVLRMTMWIFLGVLVGTWLINVVPPDWARRVLGAALASVALVEILRRERPAALVLPGRTGVAVSGFASGVAGSTANACGAVAGMYLKRHAMSHAVFISTLSIVVMLHDLFRLGVFWHFGMLTVHALYISLLLLPFAFVGAWIGTKVRNLVNERILATSTFALVLVVGVSLLR